MTSGAKASYEQSKGRVIWRHQLSVYRVLTLYEIFYISEKTPFILITVVYDWQGEILSCRFDPTGQNIAACSADRSICEATSLS